MIDYTNFCDNQQQQNFEQLEGQYDGHEFIKSLSTKKKLESIFKKRNTNKKMFIGSQWVIKQQNKNRNDEFRRTINFNTVIWPKQKYSNKTNQLKQDRHIRIRFQNKKPFNFMNSLERTKQISQKLIFQTFLNDHPNNQYSKIKNYYTTRKSIDVSRYNGKNNEIGGEKMKEMINKTEKIKRRYKEEGLLGFDEKKLQQILNEIKYR